MAHPFKRLILVSFISTSLALTGCSAVSTAVKKRNLEVKTQMSETIWLDPASQKTVYLQIKNTSDKDMSDLLSLIRKAVEAKGYTVVNNPNAAYYWIQANVLKADKMDLRDAQRFLSQGYEGAALGAAVDAMVEDVNYTMITDLQISALSNGTNVTVNDTARLKQGTSGAKLQTSTETTNRHKYQTRIVSNANKVNLKFEEAKPELENQLANSIANIL